MKKNWRLYAHGNSLLRRFAACSFEDKFRLFKLCGLAFIVPAYLWYELVLRLLLWL